MRSLGDKGQRQYQQREIDGADPKDSTEASQGHSESHRESRTEKS